jgi:ribosomal-protein-alanine N-acetyltransferase
MVCRGPRFGAFDSASFNSLNRQLSPLDNLMKNLVFRLATASDLRALIGVEKAAFRCNLISHRSFRRFLGSRTSSLIVATEQSSLVGYALLLFSAQKDCARLYSLAVAPEQKGRGVGSSLLKQAERVATRRGSVRLRLEVEESNAAARQLYVTHGYVQLRKLASYYDNGASALRFEKVIRPPTVSDYGSIN